MGTKQYLKYKRDNSESDLAQLQNEYDAEKGGYTIDTPAQGKTKGTSTFYESKLTPEQGGYYADKTLSGTDKQSPILYNPDRAEALVDFQKEAKVKATAASARIPRKAVNPTVSGKRRTARRERALKYGREGTILTGTLGGSQSDEKKKRKTLLG